MRKRANEIDCSVLRCGVGTGEHGAAIEELRRILSEMKDGYLDAFSFRLRAVEYPEELFYEVARIAKERKLYFSFLYAYQFAPPGKRSHLNAEIVQKVRKIAGEYFLGEIFGETGSDRGAKAKGYFRAAPTCMAEEMPPQNFSGMAEAKEAYVRYVRQMAEYDKKIGIEQPMLVEATAFLKYDLEAGMEIPVLEFFPGNPEALVAFARGAAVGYRKKEWGGFIACEWYGGYRHEDKLKAQRLRLAYRYLYLTGATMVYLESGFDNICSFGYEFGHDAPECSVYRRAMQEFYAFSRAEKRPSCGPLTKVAFLHGNLDGYTGFMGSSVWSQFDRKEWGMSAPEYSWRILDEVYRSRDWHDFANFGQDGRDFSCAPAYGQYDVVPVESELSVLNGYDLLIFAGWNTMTDEIYEKLKAYVSSGGKLILCAAHLNVSDRRGGEPKYLRDGKLSDLLGCDLVGKAQTNDGVKICRDGETAGVEYPGTFDFICDCNYCSGYAEYVTVMLNGGRVVAFFDDKFAPAPDRESMRPALIENKCGKGVVSFLTYTAYPGDPAVYPLYRTIVKENLTALHRNCDLKVLCGDKIRFALYYEESGEEKLYLLNTDFNVLHEVKVLYRTREINTEIAPTELKIISFVAEGAGSA